MRVAVVALGVAVAVCPLWRGSVSWGMQLAVAALVSLSLFLASASPWRAPLLVAGLAAALGTTLFQLVPLPVPIQRILSPEAVAIFDISLRPLGLYPASRPLSLDPPATAREAAKAAALLASAGAALALGSARRRREALLASVGLSTAAAAMAGLVAAVLGLGSYLEPHLVFVNPNHLAAYLALGAWPALGFGLREKGPSRFLWIVTFAIAGSGIFLTLSRGGIAAFFVGAGVFAGLYGRRLLAERHRPASWWRYAGLPVGIGAALAVAAYLALGRILSEMATVARASWEVKLANWPAVLGMVRRFPLTGIGKGAFATAFPMAQTEPVRFTFTHAENEWLQVPLDLGLPVGLALLGTLAWTWWRAARRPDLSRPEMGALAGLAAVGAHNFFDFSLELLGVALPFTAILALLAHEEPGRRISSAVSRAVAAGTLGIAIAGMAFYLGHPTEQESGAVLAARSGSDAAWRAREAARWHPADYLPHAAAGIRLVQEGRCSEAMPWLESAMRLGPMIAEPHRYAARCLAAAGRNALAKQEYRLAVVLGDPYALPEAVRRYPALTELLEIAPDTAAGLTALGALLNGTRPADAMVVWERAWREYGEVDMLHELAASTLAAGDAGRALELARELRKREPRRSRSFLLASAALERLGDQDAARAELQAGVRELPGSTDIALALAGKLIAIRHFSEARLLLKGAAWRTPGEAVQARLLSATALEAQGRLAEAMEEARSARDVDPRNTWPREVLAGLLAKAGRFWEAIAELESAAAQPGVRRGAFDARIAEVKKLEEASKTQGSDTSH